MQGEEEGGRFRRVVAARDVHGGPREAHVVSEAEPQRFDVDPGLPWFVRCEAPHRGEQAIDGRIRAVGQDVRGLAPRGGVRQIHQVDQGVRQGKEFLVGAKAGRQHEEEPADEDEEAANHPPG